MEDVTYDGTEEEGKPEGKGKVTFDKTGEEYNGLWLGGKRQGPGEFKLGDKFFYDGDFENDKFHGQGKYFTQINDINCFYEGSLENNAKHGKGKETCIATETFENSEQLQKAHEKYEWDNYWYFEGQYDEGKYSGPFKHQTTDAKIQGVIVDNQLTLSQVRTTDGTSLISNYDENKMQGKYA